MFTKNTKEFPAGPPRGPGIPRRHGQGIWGAFFKLSKNFCSVTRFSLLPCWVWLRVLFLAGRSGKGWVLGWQRQSFGVALRVSGCVRTTVGVRSTGG